MEPAPGSGERISKLWIIVLCSSLTLLSVFWSVDPSFVYFFLAVTVYAVYKILSRGFPKSDAQPPYERTSSYQKPYEHRAPNRPDFLSQVKEIFQKNAGASKPDQSKIFVALIAGFIGFMFFIAVIGAIFGDDSGEDSMLYYQQGAAYYDRQQYDSAAYFYKLASQSDPDNAEIYYAWGNAFLYGNKTDSAIIMYDEALARNPQHAQAQYNKGIVYFNRKSYSEAIAETRKILDYSPDYTDAYLLIGDSFYNQNQLDSALEQYEVAYEQGYRSGNLCHLMAYIYDVKSNTSQAITLYQEAIGQDSSIRAIYVRLGELIPGEKGDWYKQRAARMTN